MLFETNPWTSWRTALAAAHSGSGSMLFETSHALRNVAASNLRALRERLHALRDPADAAAARALHDRALRERLHALRDWCRVSDLTMAEAELERRRSGARGQSTTHGPTSRRPRPNFERLASLNTSSGGRTTSRRPRPNFERQGTIAPAADAPVRDFTTAAAELEHQKAEAFGMAPDPAPRTPRGTGPSIRRPRHSEWRRVS